MPSDHDGEPERVNASVHIEDIDSELIGIVYEAAFDPHFWPDLLEATEALVTRKEGVPLPTSPSSDVAQDSPPLFPSKLGKKESERLALLLPHLSRALRLKREYQHIDHERGQAQAILEQFPVGVLLVTDSGHILSANQQALDIITSSDVIFVEDDELCILDEELDRRLKEHIETAAKPTRETNEPQVSSLKITGEDNALPVSLLIAPDPCPNICYDRHSERCAVVFITSRLAGQRISKQSLRILFGLTPAEARLAALLASGATLEQAADHCFISKNTAKVQLKSIFAKTGTGRQAELVKLILSSPAVLGLARTDTSSAKEGDRKGEKWQVNREDGIRLKDGRRLQYAEFGDPAGTPVIFLHGVLGCRYERYPDDRVTHDLGARLIIPDRPGYGFSDYSPGLGHLDFANDLLQLIDHLEIDRIAIMGLSVGAIYGLAFAYASPDRLADLAMISSTPPFRTFSDLNDVPSSMKMLIAFSRYLPTAARLVAEIAVINACNNPQRFLANIPVCAADREVFSRPGMHAHFERCLLAGSKDCHAGFVNDILLAARPWPFPPEEIDKPVHFWHGTEDTHSPLTRIQPVIDIVPNRRLTLIEGGGHFLIYDHWQEILTALLD